MPGAHLIYEQPLNERLRVFMRLEFLLRRARANLDQDSPWAARQVLDSLLRIDDLVMRVDVKQDLIKALERHNAHMKRIVQSPQADQTQVQKVLSDLSAVLDALVADTVPLGHALKKVELFSTLRHNALIPGGDSGFEQPYLHYWLNLDAKERNQDLHNWLAPFTFIEQAITQVLWLTRKANEPVTRTAAKGFYHQSLDRAAQYQLARVSVPADAGYFAAVSGNALHLNLRFMKAMPNAERPAPVDGDVEFQLTLCPGNP